MRDETIKTREKIIPQAWGHGQNPLRTKILDNILKNQDLNLGNLIDDVSIEGGYRKEAVAREIMSLEDEGLIELAESKISKTFFQYMISPNSVWLSGSIAMIAITLVLVFLPLNLLSFLSEPFVYLRYFFGGIMVLFLPGYSLIQALFVKRSPFDDLTRYGLSLVMSLAFVIFIALVLGVSPIGIETLPITVTIALSTITLLLVALKRRYNYYAIAHYFDDGRD